MEVKNYLIKSNNFSHLFELNSIKTIDTSSLFKSQRNIKFNNREHFKPGIINIFPKYPTKKDYTKLFTNKQLKIAINYNIPKNNTNLVYLKKYNNKNIPKEIFKGNLINSFSDKKFDGEGTLYNTNKRNYFLPKLLKNDILKNLKINIAKNKDDIIKLNIENKDNNENEKTFRITSGMLSSRGLYLQRFNKLKINSLLINSFKKQDFINDEEETNPLINFQKECISRNTLNNERKESIHSINKNTKSEILSYLYEKYSSSNLSNYSMNKTNDNDITKNDIIKKEEDSTLISKRTKRYNNILISLKKNKNKIVDNNKININVLFSKVGQRLDKNKILYNLKKQNYLKVKNKESSS